MANVNDSEQTNSVTLEEAEANLQRHLSNKGKSHIQDLPERPYEERLENAFQRGTQQKKDFGEWFYTWNAHKTRVAFIAQIIESEMIKRTSNFFDKIPDSILMFERYITEQELNTLREEALMAYSNVFAEIELQSERILKEFKEEPKSATSDESLLGVFKTQQELWLNLWKQQKEIIITTQNLWEKVLQRCEQLNIKLDLPGQCINLKAFSEILGTTDPTLHKTIAIRLNTSQNSFGAGGVSHYVIQELTEILEVLRDEIERRKKPEPLRKHPRTKLPEQLPQYTFQEGRNVGRAIADGATLRGWSEVVGEVALKHAIEGEPIQTKLTAGQNLDWWDSPATHANLKNELQTLSPEATFLFQITLGLVLRERNAIIEIDDLIKLIGWKPRSIQEREKMRRAIFRWLCIFDNLTAHGKRPKSYKDRMTGQVHDLTIVSKLVKLDQLHFVDQQMRLDGSEPPVRVTLTAGSWLDQFRDDDKVLQYFGDVLKLSGLPTGQAHGEWALSIGMTLYQLWRERSAHHAEIKRNSNDNHAVTVYNRPFTRFELLNMFPPTRFAVEEILKSDRPQRAQEYFKKAIKELKEKGLISHYEELAKRPLPRKGWQETWYKYEGLDIRPAGEARKVAVELAKKGAARRRTSIKKKNISK